jgi:hypothetical protein
LQVADFLHHQAVIRIQRHHPQLALQIHHAVLRILHHDPQIVHLARQPLTHLLRAVVMRRKVVQDEFILQCVHYLRRKLRRSARVRNRDHLRARNTRNRQMPAQIAQHARPHQRIVEVPVQRGRLPVAQIQKRGPGVRTASHELRIARQVELPRHRRQQRVTLQNTNIALHDHVQRARPGSQSCRNRLLQRRPRSRLNLHLTRRCIPLPAQQPRSSGQRPYSQRHAQQEHSPLADHQPQIGKREFFRFRADSDLFGAANQRLH